MKYLLFEKFIFYVWYKNLLTLLGFEIKVYMVNKVIATVLVMVWNYFTKRWLLKGDAE